MYCTMFCVFVKVSKPLRAVGILSLEGSLIIVTRVISVVMVAGGVLDEELRGLNEEDPGESGQSFGQTTSIQLSRFRRLCIELGIKTELWTVLTVWWGETRFRHGSKHPP